MSGNVLKLKNVRLAFVQNLFTARAYKDEAGKPKKYGCKLLLDKKHPQLNDIANEIQRLATEEWKDKAPVILASIKGNNQKMSFLDGDLSTYEGFPGNYFISCARRESDGSPLYLRANPGTKEKPNLIKEADGILYSGTFVNAHISFWTWSKQGHSMNCNLLGLQEYRKGEAFTGGGASATVGEFENEETPESTVVGAGAFNAFNIA